MTRSSGYRVLGIMKPSPSRVASMRTRYHGTYLKDALAIERSGFRLGKARGRGGIMGPGIYMGSRDFASGYAQDVVNDEGEAAALLHLRLRPRKALSVDPSEWDAEFLASWRGPVPESKSGVDWPKVGQLARRLGYDAIVDKGGDWAVAFDPSIVEVVKVEPMLAPGRASEEALSSKKVAARRVAQRLAPPFTWGDVEGQLRSFKPIADTILSWRSPLSWSKFEPHQGMVQDIAFSRPGEQPSDPTKMGGALQKWLAQSWPGPLGESRLMDLRRAMRKSAFDVLGQAHGEEDPPEVDVAGLVSDTRDYVTALNDILKQAGPARFTYQGFVVLNPLRLPDSVLGNVLDGINYMVSLFKRRGVEPLLHEGLNAIRIGLDIGAAGYYHAQSKTIDFDASTSTTGLKMLKNFVHEVFVHEFGHYVHLSYLSPAGKESWDSGWVHVDSAQRVLDATVHVTSQDRQRFFGLIERSGWNPVRAGGKLKGLDRLKYLAWLYKTQGNPVISTPQQVRLTDYGRAVFRFFSDPDRYRSEFAEDNGPEKAERMMERLEKVYKGNLGLTSYYDGKNYPMLDEETVEEIRSSDSSVDEALDALGIPTTYGRTNVKEDFAETFVLFMANPSALSDQARLRMGRALWLSGFTGKPVMRLSSKRVAARWVTARVNPRTGHFLFTSS